MSDLAPRILFINDHVVCVRKLAGELSVPDRGLGPAREERPVLGPLLQAHLGRQIFPVHRLDLPVSGLLLFALSAQAHRELNGAFAARQVKKTYIAATGGQSFAHWPTKVANPRELLELQKGAKFAWHNRILRGKRRAYQSAQGQETLTLAEAESSEGEATNAVIWHWRLQPVTGRAHQLRFELSFRGFPILGDALYGGPARADLPKAEIALRHQSLDFRQMLGAKKLGLPESLSL